MASNGGGWKPGNIKPGGWLIILLIISAVYWYGIRPHAGSMLGLPGFKLPTLPFGGGAGGFFVEDMEVLGVDTVEEVVGEIVADEEHV